MRGDFNTNITVVGCRVLQVVFPHFSSYDIPCILHPAFNTCTTDNWRPLFHIWRTGKQKEHSPSLSAVMTFSWFWCQIDTKLQTYLLHKRMENIGERQHCLHISMLAVYCENQPSGLITWLFQQWPTEFCYNCTSHKPQYCILNARYVGMCNNYWLLMKLLLLI